MNYCILQMDEKVRDPMVLREYNLSRNKSDEDFVVAENFNKTTVLVDYILKKQLFDIRHIFSDMVFDVMNNFQKAASSRMLFVSDLKKKQQYAFWEVEFDVIDCIVPERLMKFSSLKLKKDMIESSCIFNIEWDKQNYIAVRFDVAECILRRFPLGIKFIPVELV